MPNVILHGPDWRYIVDALKHKASDDTVRSNERLCDPDLRKRLERSAHDCYSLAEYIDDRLPS